MEKINILLCCGAGMSSGFLASGARKAAKKKKLNVVVNARSQSEVSDYLSSIDVLLLGPHLTTELKAYKKLALPYQVPVDVIPADIYATLDGERLIDYAMNLINQNKKS